MSGWFMFGGTLLLTDWFWIGLLVLLFVDNVSILFPKKSVN